MTDQSTAVRDPYVAHALAQIIQVSADLVQLEDEVLETPPTGGGQRARVRLQSCVERLCDAHDIIAGTRFVVADTADEVELGRDLAGADPASGVDLAHPPDFDAAPTDMDPPYVVQ